MAKPTQISISGTVANGSPMNPLSTIFPSASPFVAFSNGKIVFAIAFKSSVSVNIIRIVSSTPYVNSLNAGTPLNANAEYDFQIPVSFAEGVNFQVLSGTTLSFFEAFFVEDQ